MPLSTLQLKPRGVNRKTQGQDGVAFSFLVGLFHPLQHAGLPRRTPPNPAPRALKILLDCPGQVSDESSCAASPESNRRPCQVNTAVKTFVIDTIDHAKAYASIGAARKCRDGPP